jgi:hypothetical protein
MDSNTLLFAKRKTQEHAKIARGFYLGSQNGVKKRRRRRSEQVEAQFI